MTTQPITTINGSAFEELKRINEHGMEYWSARELQPLLGYSQWRRFSKAIERAIESCEASGNLASHHFAGAGKVIKSGKGAQQETNKNKSPAKPTAPQPNEQTVNTINEATDNLESFNNVDDLWSDLES